MTEHLDYYLGKNISPVEQDISDFGKHLDRREALYRSLGIYSNAIKGKRVLEVGPGSGQNSLHVAHSMPEELVLVEPNPKGREQIKENYRSMNLPHVEPIIDPTNFIDYKRKGEKFDIAIAECWLGRTSPGLDMLRKLLDSVTLGGVVIATASPNVGLLATTCRAALAYRLIRETEMSFEEKTKTLVEAFSGHLDTLDNMSRLQLDWVQDNLLNPAVLTEVIHPIELLTLYENANILGTYPLIFESWEWYKNLYGKNLNRDRVWTQQYWEKSHNFLDVNTISGPKNPDSNRLLETTSRSLSERVIKIREHESPDFKLIQIAEEIKDLLPKEYSQVIKALDEWEDIYSKDKISVENIKNMPFFSKWFGRELVYMSFVRVH